jgi:hypothetical protein
MAAILNRASLLSALEPELRRRAGQSAGWDGLARGDQIQDDQALIRLLLGTWSALDAELNGVPIDEAHRDWFPAAARPAYSCRTRTDSTATSRCIAVRRSCLCGRPHLELVQLGCSSRKARVAATRSGELKML